jgi:hypothetical protein
MMDTMERFSILMFYVENHPEVAAGYGEEGVALLRSIVAACEAQDQVRLSRDMAAFLRLATGGQAMRGITPSQSGSTVEQLNRIKKATQAVLEKIERG